MESSCVMVLVVCLAVTPSLTLKAVWIDGQKKRRPYVEHHHLSETHLLHLS